MISLSKLSVAHVPSLQRIIDTHHMGFCVCITTIDNRTYIMLRDKDISFKEVFLNRMKHREDVIELTDMHVHDIVCDSLGSEEIRRTIYNELGVS